MAVTSVERVARGREKIDSAALDYLAAVHDIGPALAAAAEEIDRRRELPEAIVEALIERGLFRLLLPRSLAGAELLPALYIPIIEAIAAIDASTAWCINQNSGCSMTAALLAPEIAREIFGGPRGILAWGPGPGEARVAPGGYRVTASWSFASGSQHASWLGCHVPVIEADGQPRLRADLLVLLHPHLLSRRPRQNSPHAQACGSCAGDAHAARRTRHPHLPLPG